MGEPEPVLLSRAQQAARANQINNHASLIWGIAELVRGDYKQSEYGRVILPLVVMRRLDQALDDTKKDVLDKVAAPQTISGTPLRGVPSIARVQA